MTKIDCSNSCEVCTYLGFKNDPKTHIKAPSARNYCHHFSQPSGISKEMQSAYCLKGKLEECPLAPLSPVAKAPKELLRQSKARSPRSIWRKLVKSLT